MKELAQKNSTFLKANRTVASMMKSLYTVWDNCLTEIKKQVSHQSFVTWFEPIKPLKLDDKVLTIQVPSQFFYEWLEEHYVKLLSTVIHNELGYDARLEYQIVVDKGKQDEKPYTVNVPSSNKKGLQNIDNGKTLIDIENPFVIPGIKQMQIDSQLNKSYTFHSYVEGECNQLARSAGLAVADNPGRTSFNPLVFYGGSGLGKTHLAHAIGNRVHELHKDKTVLYVSSERFTNQFIDAVKRGTISEFSAFYQMIDVLIVDDIQFFARKERTQDNFFHIFNHLHQSGKQIILTSDRAPRDIEFMEERLLSRFKWGLTADLQVPDLETRIAILEKKMQAEGVEVGREVLEYIAYHIKTNVREMEGVLISLIAKSSLNGKEINLDLAKNTVKGFVKNLSTEITIESIKKVVAEYFDIDIEQLKGKTRKRHIVQARQAAMFLAKQYTGKSLKAIGKHFGGRDHSTVIHANQAVSNLIDTNERFANDMDELNKIIRMSE